MRILKGKGPRKTISVPQGTRRVSRVYAVGSSSVLSIDGTAPYAMRMTEFQESDIHWPEGLTSVKAKARPPKTADEWVRRNFGKIQRHSGKWVAVTERGIVGTSKDFDETYAIAKAKGIINPLVFKVPSKDTRTKIVSNRKR